MMESLNLRVSFDCGRPPGRPTSPPARSPLEIHAPIRVDLSLLRGRTGPGSLGAVPHLLRPPVLFLAISYLFRIHQKAIMSLRQQTSSLAPRRAPSPLSLNRSWSDGPGFAYPFRMAYFKVGEQRCRKSGAPAESSDGSRWKSMACRRETRQPTKPS